jgi:hypothetical protein
MGTYYQKNKEKLLAKQKEWYSKNRERRINYSKEYAIKRLLEDPLYYKKLREKYKEKQRECYKKWYYEKGRVRTEAQIEVILEYKQEHPDRVKINQKTGRAVRGGKIIRPEICSKCHKKAKIQAHHFNYDHWKNFIWLCASCHKLEHNFLKTNVPSACL